MAFYRRLIWARVEPIINSLLPKDQAGFRRGKLIVDQVVLLTQNIEDFFKAKKKAGVILVNLTAAYDIVWHRGLTCKLLKLLPDTHMLRMIMEFVQNCRFILTTGDRKQSRLRYLKKTAFLRDRSQFSSFLTSMRTICLSRFLESLLMLTILHCYTLLETGRTWRDFKPRHVYTFSISVLGKDTLRHFPLLGGLDKQF